MRRHYEDRHLLREHDFAVLEKFDFKYAPVGFKFFNTRPEVPGLEPLGEKMAWCQMLPAAQAGRAFYAEAGDQYCEPGLFLPGHVACDPVAGGGRIGPPFDIYPDERANRRVYDSLSLLAVGSVHSTAFAPLSLLTFDPDLLILTCDNMDQTERVLRAVQYDTGEVLESRMTYVMGCNWMFNYPYVSGKVNYVTTGLAYGMKMYKLYPAGMQIVSIPWHHIDRILRNMREMPWSCPGHTDEKDEFYKTAHERLGVEQMI